MGNGSSDSDKSLDVDVDSQGDVYVSGFYNNQGTFGPINMPFYASSKEAYVAKLDSLGNYIWVRSCHSGLDDRGLGVHVDPFDNVLFTGTYWYNGTFQATNTGGSADESFIAKYDSNGGLLWAQHGGSSGDDHCFDVVSDARGDHYVTGFLSTHYGPVPSGVAFGNLPAFQIYDSIAYVGKLSAAGTWLWVKTFGGNDVERDNDIALDSLGNVYVAGGFYRTRTFGPQTLTSTVNSRDIFVAKWDSTGNFQWVVTAGDSLDDRANGICIDKAQNIYITGEFRDRVGFGTADTINNYGGPGGRDIFVAKLTTQGNWVWAQRAGATSGGDRGNAITTDHKGLLFVTGQMRGNVHFGNDTTVFCAAADTLQIFAACIDTSGDWKWAVQAGGPDEDRGNGIAIDTAGCRIYVAGFIDAPSADFGSDNLPVIGRKDGFVARLNGGCYVQNGPPPPPPPTPTVECTAVVPLVFTPNGDGINDDFELIDGACVETVDWKIFNRWGQIVFETTDPAKKWDGHSTQGNLLSDGVYYYVLKVTMVNGEEALRKGFVSLYR
ncbi:MAG: hypothetical protein FD123_1157 [Bacteroidetes bacterium]|nr:MAG: hypothetical protein FD123_1157 [Bacteroidota bacterium]